MSSQLGSLPRYALGANVQPNVAFVTIIWRFPAHNPQVGKFEDIARFAYEKEVWYTLKIEREGNRYHFWIGDFGLFTEDDSLTSGSIGLHFYGRCNIWLDDFTVSGPDVPDGGPGVLGVNPFSKRLTTTWGKLKAQN